MIKTDKYILINALGIADSGGITVLNKMLEELTLRGEVDSFFIVCNDSKNIQKAIKKYQYFHFIIANRGVGYRLYYENFIFRRLVKKYNIQLIYNFSGSAQLGFLVATKQLIKIHNLLFYSTKLDVAYQKKNEYFLWIKQILLKRVYLKFMLSQSKYIEIQSNHVKNCLSDFINIKEKEFYIKSDINVIDKSFSIPKKYDFSKKIKFLYVVGPHFKSIHKNLIVFVNAMSSFDKLNIDYEINITLSKDQLHNSEIWNPILDSKTNFLGYIDNQNEMNKLFCNNAVLISTSIIETLGLHVIEGIKNGIITITPNENYARTVYGDNMFQYDLMNRDSLVDTIMSIINCKESYSENILSIQDDLRQSEMSKFSSILDVFDEVLNVQK